MRVVIIMAIKEPLQEPIYEIQEGEMPKQYYFFRLFCLYIGTIENFADAMVSEWNLNGKQKLKYKPYTRTTFSTLATNHKWLDRKAAKEVDDIQEIFLEMDRIDKESKIEKFRLQSEARTKNLKLLNERLDSGDIKGSQIESHSKANKNFQDAERTDLEKAVEITDNHHNIEGSIDSTVEARGNISEEIILKPDYVELTRKLLEDVTNEEKGTDNK